MFGWSDAEEKHGWRVSNSLRFVEPCPPPALARQFRSFFELVWAVPTPESLSCYIKQLPQPFEPSHPELCVLHNDVPFPCAVTIEGVEYASAEHYYQAIRTQCNRQRTCIVAAIITSCAAAAATHSHFRCRLICCAACLWCEPRGGTLPLSSAQMSRASELCVPSGSSSDRSRYSRGLKGACRQVYNCLSLIVRELKNFVTVWVPSMSIGRMHEI